MRSSSTVCMSTLIAIGALVACSESPVQPGVAAALPFSSWHASAGPAMGYSDVFLTIGQSHTADQATAFLRFVSVDTTQRPDLMVYFNVVLGRQTNDLTFLVDIQSATPDISIRGIDGCGSLLAPVSADHTCQLRGMISFDGKLTDGNTLSGDLFANGISPADTTVNFAVGFGGPLTLRRCSGGC